MKVKILRSTHCDRDASGSPVPTTTVSLVVDEFSFHIGRFRQSPGMMQDKDEPLAKLIELEEYLAKFLPDED